MPGKPYLNRKVGGRGAPGSPERERAMAIEAGIRQQWREGASNTAPVKEDEALAAAARARANGAAPRMAERPLASAMKSAGLPYAHKPIGGE